MSAGAAAPRAGGQGQPVSAGAAAPRRAQREALWGGAPGPGSNTVGRPKATGFMTGSVYFRLRRIVPGISVEKYGRGRRGGVLNSQKCAGCEPFHSNSCHMPHAHQSHTLTTLCVLSVQSHCDTVCRITPLIITRAQPRASLRPRPREGDNQGRSVE